MDLRANQIHLWTLGRVGAMTHGAELTRRGRPLGGVGDGVDLDAAVGDGADLDTELGATKTW